MKSLAKNNLFKSTTPISFPTARRTKILKNAFFNNLNWRENNLENPKSEKERDPLLLILGSCLPSLRNIYKGAYRINSDWRFFFREKKKYKIAFIIKSYYDYKKWLLKINHISYSVCLPFCNKPTLRCALEMKREIKKE